ncbi:MAG: zinc-dependent metalloprotease [Chitinophagales bacterium]|nr:zinc-dependent metalloprotease [Chitinophagales bacterium]
MIKLKKLVATIVFIIVSTTKLFATTTTSEFAIVFHLFKGSTYSDQDLYDAVCRVNQIYNEPPNDAHIYFVLTEVKRSNATPYDRPNAIANSPKVGNAINIYCYGNYALTFGAYSPQDDAVFFQTPESGMLAHEIGHFMGLYHLDPNQKELGRQSHPLCDCDGHSPDNDCVGDTPNTTFFNVMDKGSGFGNFFTAGQEARAKECMHKGKWFKDISSSIGAVAITYNNVLLLPYLTTPEDGNTGILEFSMPFNSTPQMLCSFNQPTTIQVIVTTQCPEGSNKRTIVYNLTSFTGSIPVDLKWGIQKITYIYNYPDGSQRTIDKIYTIPRRGGNCDEQPKFGTTNISNIQNEKLGFKVVNSIVSSDIKVINNGYKSISIFDLSGRTLQNTNITNGDNTIDISNLQPGNYIIKAFGEHSTTQERFSKL